MNDFTPSKDFIRQQFNTYVRDQVFGAARAPETGRPVFIFLGGQPAAGKSLAQRKITERNPQANLVPITGDKYREFHPDFDNLTLLDPL